MTDDDSLCQRPEGDLQDLIGQIRADFELSTHWSNHSLGSETYWLFKQAFEALRQQLYLPACTTFITGIEASIRNTLAQLQNPVRVETVDDIAVLSNGLLRRARDCGLPIEKLAFPEERDFEAKVLTRTHVELVRVRHNLCHGNILEYIQETDDIHPFFTPECCAELAETLHTIARNWVTSLGVFRKQAFGLQPQPDAVSLNKNHHL